MKGNVSFGLVIFCLFALIALGLTASTLDWSASPDMIPVVASKKSVLAHINQVVNKQPRYRTWSMFPSNNDKHSIGASSQESRYGSDYYLKRLGLPVHGRWVSTYVNPVAYKFLSYAITVLPDVGRLQMPVGSIIVKENFRTAIDFKAANNMDDSIQPAEGPLPRPAVLTILYKAGDEFCQTGVKFNGAECLGGGWLWIFSGVNSTSKLFDSQVEPQSFCINCHAPAYNSDYLRSLQSQRRAFREKQQPFERLAGTPATGSDVCEGLDKVNSDLPHDVPADPAKTGNAQKMFDCLSWKTFVALNWPASKNDRGRPNEKIKQVKQKGFMEGPRVWQTYKETYELFQPTDVDWDPSHQKWNDPPPAPHGDGCDTDLPLVSMIAKNQSRSVQDVANETGQAFAGSFGMLKDQNSQLVRYEVRFNRDEFDYVLDTRSAITRNLLPSGPANPDLPDNLTGKYGGAIEIKAAWREICSSEWELKNNTQCFPAIDDQSQYYIQDVLVYHPQNKHQKAFCEVKTMGLIALHIAHKTHWAPQWVWSTFSYKNNVPDANDAHAQATAFFDPSRVPTDNDACWLKPFLISPENCPNVELNRFARPADLPPDKFWPGTDLPNQITRLQTIEGSGLNQKFSKLLAGTPFENYVLLDTQWPLNGRNAEGSVNVSNCNSNTLGDNCFTMIPRYLRNPVVESYMTTYNYQREQYSNRSCMGCHTEGGANASYLWLDGVEQIVPIKR